MERVLERRQALACAEMAALCAVIARRGLASPYGGEGYASGSDERAAEGFEQAAVDLLFKVEQLQAQTGGGDG